ncbi:MAG: CRISPR-associated endonuclease Cas3'' [Nitrospirae bacterium]|nr:CRISPR-associated endonuclease Cas3'' [Nitrospirota bacterium]
MTDLYAHTPNERGEWHYLDKHLIDVAEKAKGFAGKFGASDAAYALGLLHDLGKVNPEFQDYLKACARDERHGKVPHSIWGAALAYAVIHKGQEDMRRWEELSMPIMGHHAGLADRGNAATKLHDFDAEPLKRMRAALKTLRVTFPSIKFSASSATQRELFIRMMFSTLVDADYLDTEKHFDPEQATLRGWVPLLEALWQELEAKQNLILNDSTLVDRIRKEVYEACLDAAVGETGIYRLTVPTGGGKTRSGLAFALKHALTNELGRVIVAIPYTSIIDQTAQVYRELLGADAVLEHHSAVEIAADDSDRQDERFIRHKLATENWDAPLIVTTTVQLFESLFGNRPSKVRKLHRLTKAVIVLDEVQTLPPELLRPTLDVLRILATPVEQGGYGSTVVLCTATQPAYEDSRWLESFQGVAVSEIVPQYSEHFSKLKRVNYVRCPEPLSWAVLAEEVGKLSQVLVVLNTRKDTLALVAAMGDAPDVFHLSTLLCGAHRKVILAEVKRRLDPRNPQPVRLISTQVVEAGVDLDFPVVYRAVGPLDRIVQAAGRCNRENKLDKGKVVIFEPAEGKAPGGPYKVGIEKARFLLNENPVERLHDPDLYREYFSRLFADVDLDKKRIQSYREELNYPEVSNRYRLIEKDTVSVVVPYKDALVRFSAWEAAPSYRTWSALQPYIVNLYRYEVLQKRDWLDQRSEGLYVWTGSYDGELGLMEGFNDPADLVV